jgi:hypothetical protein
LIIQTGRHHTDTGQNHAQLALIYDEVANTPPLPDLPIYATEARGLGVAVPVAVQLTEQLPLR